MPTQAQKVLDELTAIADELAVVEGRMKKLKARRLVLWVRGRKLRIAAAAMAAASTTKAVKVTPGDLRQYLWRHDHEKEKTDG